MEVDVDFSLQGGQLCEDMRIEIVCRNFCLSSIFLAIVLCSPSSPGIRPGAPSGTGPDECCFGGFEFACELLEISFVLFRTQYSFAGDG